MGGMEAMGVIQVKVEGTKKIKGAARHSGCAFLFAASDRQGLSRQAQVEPDGQQAHDQNDYDAESQCQRLRRTEPIESQINPAADEGASGIQLAAPEHQRDLVAQNIAQYAAEYGRGHTHHRADEYGHFASNATEVPTTLNR